MFNITQSVQVFYFAYNYQFQTISLYILKIINKLYLFFLIICYFSKLLLIFDVNKKNFNAKFLNLPICLLVPYFIFLIWHTVTVNAEHCINIVSKFVKFRVYTLTVFDLQKVYQSPIQVGKQFVSMAP